MSKFNKVAEYKKNIPRKWISVYNCAFISIEYVETKQYIYNPIYFLKKKHLGIYLTKHIQLVCWKEDINKWTDICLISLLGLL